MGYGEMAAGAGLLAGPIVGGWIYANTGYFWCYIVLGGLIISDMIFTWFVMPNSVNNFDEDNHEGETE